MSHIIGYPGHHAPRAQWTLRVAGGGGLPEQEEFPTAIRVTVVTLESRGRCSVPNRAIALTVYIYHVCI